MRDKPAFGLPCEGFEQGCEKFLRHAVGNIPEGFAGGRRCEGRDIESVEPVMAMRDRTLADGRPHVARDRLQADAVSVCRKDLDLFAGMLRCLPGNGVRELYGMARPSFGRYGFAGSSTGEVDHEDFRARHRSRQECL
jgi:hypothetical protein